MTVTVEDAKFLPMHDKEVVGDLAFFLLEIFSCIGSWQALKSTGPILAPPSKDIIFLKNADPELHRLGEEVAAASEGLSSLSPQALMHALSSLGELSKKLADREVMVYQELSAKHKADTEHRLNKYSTFFLPNGKQLYFAFINTLAGAIEVSERIYL